MTILREEIDRVLALVGVTGIDELRRELLSLPNHMRAMIDESAKTNP